MTYVCRLYLNTVPGVSYRFITRSHPSVTKRDQLIDRTEIREQLQWKRRLSHSHVAPLSRH